MSFIDGGNASYNLSISEKEALEETYSFTRNCESKLAQGKKKFADKSTLGLWWDAKGIFSSSNVKHVTDEMESFESFYKEINTLSAQVEKGDTEGHETLLHIYEKLEKNKRCAQRDVEKNQSSAVCKMLREFLDKKHTLDHNLKKVECVVLKQKMNKVEKTFSKVNQLIEKFGGINVEEFIETMRKKEEELASKADERCEAIRRESDKKLKKVLEETEERSEARIRELKTQNYEMRLEADKRSEAIRRESDEKLKLVLKEAEDRAEARIAEMKKENAKLRLEAENIRRESDEMLNQAIEEVNRKSEARMQEMAEQNRANLQTMTRMLEDMNLP